MFLEELSGKYIPYMALVVYSKNGDNDDHSIPSHQLEAFDFIPDEQNEQYVLTAGRPVTPSTLNALAEFLLKRSVNQKLTKKDQKIIVFRSSRIPFNILSVYQKVSSIKIAFTLIRPIRAMLFHDSLNLPNGSIKLPNLLVIYHQGDVKVFAFKDDLITDNTVLYHAPFHNTTDKGVCMGSVKIKFSYDYWENLVDSIDHAFFNSYFTHLNGANPINGNLNVIYHQCITQKKDFPLEVLLPTKIKLKDLL